MMMTQAAIERNEYFERHAAMEKQMAFEQKQMQVDR